jgi:hypothetical protein
MTQKTFGWVMWTLGFVAGFCAALILFMIAYRA